MKRIGWLAILIMAFLIQAGSSGLAQTDKSGMIKVPDKSGAMPKVGRDLSVVYQEYTTYQAQGGPGVFTSKNPLLSIVNARVSIDAMASADVSALQADLEALGMQGAVAAGRIVSGWFAISAIDALAALGSLQFARPAYASTHVGLVTSQGDQAMRSDVARTNFGVDGAGVTVGVLSDSFNCLGGAATDVANNDLSPVNVLQDETGCGSGSDEGRAMLQLVHDVAPGAGLAFATAFGGQAVFANNILASQAAGAGVIVDDVGYFAEPMFQDGVIAQAVNTVVGLGVSYFSSAGNSGRNAYQSAFNPGPVSNGSTFHDFDPGAGEDICQSVTIPANSSFIVSLQWDSPFFSVSGAPGSPNDVDIFLFDDNCTQLLAVGNDFNVGGDAVEVLQFSNGGPAFTGNLVILRFDGPAPNFMKYVVFGQGTIDEFATNSGTIFGHANAVGAEAVGAAAFFNTPAFGASPPVLETFSSAGTTPILFTTTGVPTFDPRADKPEIVAADGTNTTFFVADIPEDADAFPNFFGTSAAAPHAAAVAALLLESVPTLTPSSVYTALESTAIDMGPAGFDNDSGFGLIQADLALATAITIIPVSPWEFAVFDWDRDSVPDLVGIFKGPTGSGQTELHVLSGASHFQSFLDQVATALPQTPEGWEFAVADWDGDAVPDLVGIFKGPTGSGQTELHVLSGASHFQSFLDQVATALPQTPEGWEFVVANVDGDAVPDLVGIFKGPTGSGQTELHVLSGASHFQSFLDQVATALPQTPEGWEFAVANVDGDNVPDLVGIFKGPTGSGQTELHVLSGLSHFQTFVDQVATALPQTPEGWEFGVANADGEAVPDLVGIFKGPTGSGQTELHVLSGASDFQSFIDQVATALPQTNSN